MRSNTSRAASSSSIGRATGGPSFQVTMHSTCTVHKLFVLEGIGWYFNKLFPHTELFGDFISRSIETGRSEENALPSDPPPAGLITAWTQRTWAGMRQEYLSSGEERIELPEISETGQCLLSSNTRHGSSCILNLCSRPAELWRRGGGVLPPSSWDCRQHYRPLSHDHRC